jgi:hypothetical protein
MIELRLAGYMARHVVARPESLSCPAVVDVCSASECMSPRPEGWMHHWIHNRLWLFDTPEQARRVVPSDAPLMTLFAYRIATVRYDAGREDEWEWPDVAPEPLSDRFESIGFDAFGKEFEMHSIVGFGCSPLSCNNCAPEWPVNSHCLLPDLATAAEAARQFSIEQPEPGMYYVAEVLAAPRY